MLSGAPDDDRADRAGMDNRRQWPPDLAGRQHHAIASYLNLLIGLGFAISGVEEGGPGSEQVSAHPEWANEAQHPAFLLVSARKN